MWDFFCWAGGLHSWADKCDTSRQNTWEIGNASREIHHGSQMMQDRGQSALEPFLRKSGYTLGYTVMKIDPKSLVLGP
jgi:hypothetical protein